MAEHPESIRAQIMIARDHYRQCFGCDPRGIWLPECAYVPGIEKFLQEANIRWFIMDTHGIMFGHPRPRYGIYAPVFTPTGVAAFGRDVESSKQVWSSEEGYPATAIIAISTATSASTSNTTTSAVHPPGRHPLFTGMKYFRITGKTSNKSRTTATTRWRRPRRTPATSCSIAKKQVEHLVGIMKRPPLIISPTTQSSTATGG